MKCHRHTESPASVNKGVGGFWRITSMIHTIRLAALLGAILVVSSCATESVGTSEVSAGMAHVVAPSRVRTWLDPATTWSPTIDSLDGVKIKAATSRVQVTPGHHTLGTSCGSHSRPQNLEFDAVAGATYELGMTLAGGALNACSVSIRRR
jgi:hypothetical protein